MDAESKRIREQIKNLPFKERVSNYWNYYKVHFFVAVACIAIFGTSIVQCATQIKYDLTVSMYSSVYFSDERVAEMTELLKEQCDDVTGDEAVNVSISTNVADITSDRVDEMVQGIYMKLQAELAASTSAAFIMDENYKNFLVEAYEYPAEDVVEISSVPEVKDRLKLAEDEKLYWLPAFQHKESDKPDQFDNAKLIKIYFENK